MAPSANLTTTQARGLTTVQTNLKALPRVFILALQSRRKLQEEYSQIFGGLIPNTSITAVIRDADIAAATVSTPPRSGDVVLVADGAVCDPAHTTLLYKLVLFAHEGGTVVLAMDFSNELVPTTVRTFFGRWGLSWDVGEYERTTFALNLDGVQSPLSLLALQPEYSMKGVLLKDVPCAAAVYLPMPNSLVGAQMTPAAFARIGKGFLGYVGDVNGEQGSARLTLEMCGVAIEPGDMGYRRYVSSTSFRNGVVVDEKITVEREIPLPYASNTVPKTAPPQGNIVDIGFMTIVEDTGSNRREAAGRAPRRGDTRSVVQPSSVAGGNFKNVDVVDMF